MKKFVIEKIYNILCIIEIILITIYSISDKQIMVEYIKILGIIIIYILPIIMIIKFLVNPQSGEGFSSWRSDGSSKTVNCILISDLILYVISKKYWNVYKLIGTGVIVITSIVLIHYYLKGKIEKDEKQNFQLVASMYFGFVFYFLNFI